METLRTNGMAGNKITARYSSRKGVWEPAVEKIVLGMVDKNYLGWYFFGLSVSGGVHSVILVVDNSDGLTTKIYWMDQFSRGFTKNVTGKLDKELKDWEPSYGYESTIVWPLIPSAETVVKIPMSL
jgi:hypothetical protein